MLFTVEVGCFVVVIFVAANVVVAVVVVRSNLVSNKKIFLLANQEG
jgi:hypothetical protein